MGIPLVVPPVPPTGFRTRWPSLSLPEMLESVARALELIGTDSA